MKQNRSAEIEGRGRSPRPRKRKWHCGFCGLPSHGTRSGILRCINRTARAAISLGVPFEHATAQIRPAALRYAVNPQRIVSIEHMMEQQIEHGQLSNDLRK